MDILSSESDFEHATNSHPDPAFRALLSRLLLAISGGGEFDPTELVRFIVVGPGDSMEAVETALLPASPSEWEAIDQEGGWTAVIYLLSDWGDGVIVLIPDRPDLAADLLRLRSEALET